MGKTSGVQGNVWRRPRIITPQGNSPAHIRYVRYKLCDYTLWTEPEHAPRIGRMQAAQKKLGKRIATLRNQKRISQEAFAARCQINRVHMSAIERGKVNLTIATLRKIARNL